ncbi:MAG TPA: twin-arginine translocation signal domain-containing protein [Verrucomicrobiota bacterium]|mgnify:FL=1|nr:twin-arginine translocation signal domain-containing protein [Verrucomicrobiota bacterium]HOC51295.1 twin-arginine translocation signal domain-containing protein [Verrucomicrobiota bacterium]HPC54003.1 twin-arginine translocation signal domain-containing protein [Verrucomicrobiota bacterium]HPL36791.1 twin-arginine translocation signal domain-containing protein [Verrucomicrobiota bacterium]HPV92560.1 twin-arginine translocation signal domain-containing protein [Verrucomicrobiota bacterium]
MPTDMLALNPIQPPSRRQFLRTSAVTALAAALPGSASARASSRRGTVRDRLWIWAHDGQFYNCEFGLPRKSRITPVEGAFYMGVPNVMFIQYQGVPVPPFEQYYVPFKALRRVFWTLSNNANQMHRLGAEQEHVYRLAAANPNIQGLLLDDYLIGPLQPAAGRQWLAENSPAFPVTLTLRLAAPARANTLELQQTDWESGDYRTARLEVDVAAREDAWAPVGRFELPNEPGARLRVPLPPGALAAVRVQILSTHDPQGARSCGLNELRLLADGQPLALDGAQIHASSQFPGHEAFHLLDNRAAPGQSPGYAAQVGLDDLAAARRRMAGLGRPLELAAVVYAHQLDPAIAPLLAPIDTVLFWTWRAAELPGLEANFRRLKQLLPGKRVLLGCYMWNFGEPNGPMPLAQLARQCDLGLRWLQAGEIEGLIFLGTNICDLDLEAVEWTRRWIATHGDKPLKR